MGKRRILKNLILIGSATCTIFGCKEKRTEVSNLLHEDAVVTSSEYIPGEDNLVVGVALNNPALGIAMSSKEQYRVAFKGENLDFTVNSSYLYAFLDVGSVVDVSYKEIYKCTYDDLDGDGKKDLVKKVLKKQEILEIKLKEEREF